MPSLLHLISTDADTQTRAILEAITTRLAAGFDQTTHTIGPGGDCRHLPAVVSATKKLGPDVVYAWGTTAALAAVITKAKRIVYSPDRPIGPSRLRWVRAIASGRNITAVWPTQTQARLATAAGLHPARSFVIRPGADFNAIGPRDGSLRKTFGWAEDDFVLLAPGESTPQSGHDMAVWTCGILNVLSPKFKMLTWGRGDGVPKIASLCRRLRQSEMTRAAQTELARLVRFEEILPAADAVLITAAGIVPTLPIAQAMAAGLPIVTTVTGTVAELVRDNHSALVVPKRSPRALSRKVLDLQADNTLRWNLSGNARADAYERLSITQMIRQYRTLLTQVAGDRPVDPDATL
jgi:glycosyltransferase involved in cell wall biosynthesis